MQLTKLSKNIYEIPKTGKMKVPGVIYASDELIENISEGKTLQQISNVASLPGIIKASYAMPDAHQGYGFPIGGVAAFDSEKGVISPAGIGYDINCSVRLLKTNLTKKQVQEHKELILKKIFAKSPTGLNARSALRLSHQQLKDILVKGAGWALENKYATKKDIERIEDNGCLEGADPMAISPKAFGRGINQMGSIGSGNHFLDILEVNEILDEKIAKAFGLKKGQITIMVHCGSRGLGHQVATDYIKAMTKEYGIESFPDPELVSAPIKSELGKKYYAAMAAAANFGFCNKQIITHFIRQEIKKIIPSFKAEVVYDICHNIAKFEDHVVDGKKKKLLIHRKGAARSWGPGRKEIPEVYRKIGQPVLLPGSMGTSSYVLVGTKKAESISFSSMPHGAGRKMSRTKARDKLDIEKVKKKMKEQDISTLASSYRNFITEAPEAYKDVDEVVKVCTELGLGKPVAKMQPLAVMQG